MDELERRKRGLEFADQLSLLAADSPDLWTEKQVHTLAGDIRKRFTYSKDLKKREILGWLRKHNDRGGLSIAELVEQTGYHKDLLYELTRELEQDGAVECRRLRPAGGGAGRPSVRFFAVTVNFSAQKS